MDGKLFMSIPDNNGFNQLTVIFFISFFRSAKDTAVGEDDLLFGGMFLGEAAHIADFRLFWGRLFVMISNFLYVVKSENLFWVMWSVKM